jgi:hypothetical protein
MIAGRGNPVTDLERFIEGHLRRDLDQYAQLPEDDPATS